MVKTNRAKKQIRILCSQRLREIDELSGRNIINTVFSKSFKDVTSIYNVDSLQKIPHILDYFKHVKHQIEKKNHKRSRFCS